MACVCRLAGLALALLFSACVSAPAPDPVTAQGEAPVPPVPPTPPKLAVPPVPEAFARLAPWSQAEIAPGLLAFKRSCRAITGREAGQWLSPSAPWAGRVGDWQPACAAMENAGDTASARTILETLFLPVEVMAQEGDSRFTGYFEPTIEARKQPVAPFTAPVPGPPQDMVRVGGRPMQRRPDGRLRPYPPRAQITAPTPIAYAHPADVFFLQIQGSGRLQFPDGASLRAVYHANNGHPFRSTANWLIRKGELSRGEASMQGIRAWMDRASAQERRSAMNANPRYVFFAPQPVGDPKLGPAGAAGQPLVALGSMAVDDRRHAYGVPYLVSTSAPGLGGEWSGLLVAQDTGGAIRGAVRGDIFFGTGERAGERAGTMNAPGRMWALLPRSVAERLARPARQTDDATS